MNMACFLFLSGLHLLLYISCIIRRQKTNQTITQCCITSSFLMINQHGMLSVSTRTSSPFCQCYNAIITDATPGVRWINRQLAKCEWNSGLASKNTNPLASLARVFSPLNDLFLVFWLGEWKSWTTHQFGKCIEKLTPTPDKSLTDEMFPFKPSTHNRDSMHKSKVESVIDGNLP
jgi:hypothetical protein